MPRQSRRTRRIGGEEQVEGSEGDHESLGETYAPTPAERDDERSSPGEEDRLASFGGEDQYFRTRSTAFTRRLNARLGDIREQEGVIEAICRGAYRPTGRSRLAAGEPRTDDRPPESSSPDVSQVQYTGPTRCGGLKMSIACCWTVDQDSDQDEDEEPAGQTSPEAIGGGHNDDREPSIQSTEDGAAEGTSTDEPTTPMLGWGGANPREDRDNWGGAMRPASRWGVGVPPAGWAGALQPSAHEGYTGCPPPSPHPDG